MSTSDELSSGYDRGMRPLEWLIFRRLRRKVFPASHGDVLELGVGTGVNLPLYGSGARVVGCDASSKMLEWASRRVVQSHVVLVQADVQRLPFADASFDAVTGSLVFCSIANPTQGLVEARRVLRQPQPAEGQPGGQLVLVEHTRGSGLGAWLTDLLHPLWHRLSRDCHLNRKTTQAIADAGFRVQRVERHALGIVRVIEAIT
jgi:ubiquinone/menaquinone biosynthesis C-methylase UbiE